MGGGVCWLDYNGDGRLDLFVVNSLLERRHLAWDGARRACRAASSYENDSGHFGTSPARPAPGCRVQGDGCVAADLERRRAHRLGRHNRERAK